MLTRPLAPSRYLAVPRNGQLNSPTLLQCFSNASSVVSEDMLDLHFMTVPCPAQRLVSSKGLAPAVGDSPRVGLDPTPALCKCQVPHARATWVNSKEGVPYATCVTLRRSDRRDNRLLHKRLGYSVSDFWPLRLQNHTIPPVPQPPAPFPATWPYTQLNIGICIACRLVRLMPSLRPLGLASSCSQVLELNDFLGTV